MQEIQIITTDKFERWLRSIVDIRSRRKITLRIQRLKLGNFGDYKSVGQEVYELRIHFGPGYRVYFAKKRRAFCYSSCRWGQKFSIKRYYPISTTLAGD